MDAMLGMLFCNRILAMLTGYLFYIAIFCLVSPIRAFRVYNIALRGDTVRGLPSQPSLRHEAEHIGLGVIGLSQSSDAFSRSFMMCRSAEIDRSMKAIPTVDPYSERKLIFRSAEVIVILKEVVDGRKSIDNADIFMEELGIMRAKDVAEAMLLSGKEDSSIKKIVIVYSWNDLRFLHIPLLPHISLTSLIRVGYE